MKFALAVLGMVFIVIAAIYFGLPADKLPSFFPGHQAGLDQIHVKHGLAAAAVGLILLFASMRMRRLQP